MPSAPEALSRAVLTSASNSVTALTASLILVVYDISTSRRSGSWRMALASWALTLLKS